MQTVCRSIATPIGILALIQQDECLTELRFEPSAPRDLQQGNTLLLKEAEAQLTAYFGGRLTAFDLPLRLEGTPFRQECWAALRRIPYGEVRTYAQQAQMIQRPGAARAVGMANHHNPLPIFIPCHRIIGANGALTGYAGGLWRKQWLLELEKRTIRAKDALTDPLSTKE